MTLVAPPENIIDYYLRFTDEVEATNAMKEAGYTAYIEGNDVIQSKLGVCINPIGILYETTVTGDDIVAVPLDGWHVNIRKPEGLLPEALMPFKVYPQNPKNVWA